MPRDNRLGLALAALAVVGVLIALAALLDLGPFADDELSPAAFVARGDEICSSAHDQFNDQQRVKPRTAKEAEELTANLIAISTKELDQLRELNPPTNDAARFKRYLSAREKGIAVLHDGEKAAQNSDVDAYEAAQAKVAATQLRRAGAAHSIGFNECSQPLVSRDRLKQFEASPSSSAINAPPTVNNPPTGTPAP